jgi:hypothetical protein
MSRRIIVEDLCEHGNVLCYYRVGEDDCGSHGKCADPSHYCPGGSRTILDGPTDEMVERASKAIRLMMVSLNRSNPDYLPKSAIVGASPQELARAALSAALGGEE